MINVVAGIFGLSAAVLFEWLWHLAARGSCSDNQCSGWGEAWNENYWLMELGGSVLAFLLGAAVVLLMRRWFLQR